MVGPKLDPQKVAEFEAGFTGQPQKKPNPLDIAGQAVQGYQQALPSGSPGAMPSPAPSPEASAHLQAMHEAAEERKQKYMQEHGVDENGDPVVHP